MTVLSEDGVKLCGLYVCMQVCMYVCTHHEHRGRLHLEAGACHLEAEAFLLGAGANLLGVVVDLLVVEGDHLIVNKQISNKKKSEINTVVSAGRSTSTHTRRLYHKQDSKR